MAETTPAPRGNTGESSRASRLRSTLLRSTYSVVCRAVPLVKGVERNSTALHRPSCASCIDPCHGNFIRPRQHFTARAMTSRSRSMLQHALQRPATPSEYLLGSQGVSDLTLIVESDGRIHETRVGWVLDSEPKRSINAVAGSLPCFRDWPPSWHSPACPTIMYH